MSTHAFANPFRPMNPFLASEEIVVDEATSAEQGEVCYALVASGPAVSSEEVESHLEAVEVKVTWGNQVLKVAHLATGKSFRFGEGADFVLPEGHDHTGALVEARGAMMVAMIPRGASAMLERKGSAAAHVEGGQEIVLGADMKLAIAFGDIAIEVTTVRAGKKTPIGFLASLATGAAATIGLSFLGHAAVVASMAMFMPSIAPDDADTLDRDQILMMQKLLNASAERAEEMTPPKDEAGDAQVQKGGGQSGQPHKGESGAAGTTNPQKAQGHMAMKGNDGERALSRKDEIALAADFGLVGLLRGGADASKVASPWGDIAKGMDPLDAKGNMWSANIGDALGTGLGLTGLGEGGGGTCDKCVGIDKVGTIGGGGGGDGIGIGPGKDGIGRGSAPAGGGHVTKAPIMRTPVIDTNGSIPREVIQRIVRQNYGRFRLCYENGLRNNPSLNGRVVTKFVIDRTGAVSMAQDGGSDMPNQAVTQCVVRGFGNLSFPAPEHGIVTVSYPIIFSPAES